MIIKGQYTEAKVFTDKIEDRAVEEIRDVTNHSIFKNEIIRIMPDVHSGMGCVIGFTSSYNSGKIIPNLIGVDISCGMLTVELGKLDIDLVKLDRFIRKKIKHGFQVNENIQEEVGSIMKNGVANVCTIINDEEKFDRHLKSIGSLGGGNHFIEISEDKAGCKYLIIHSGSRNFGNRIAKHFQNIAKEKCSEELRADLKYLDDEQDIKDYLNCSRVAGEFAEMSRMIMAKRITDFLEIEALDSFETVHNYVEQNGGHSFIRKGAVSAKKDEKLLIPLNMRDGSILATGKGNPDWNYSAPHGAGRLMSRTKAKANLTMEYFHDTMKDIYSTSICKDTLDEAPEAYKPMQDILDAIKDTVDIIDILKPIYNFKSH